MLIGDYARVCSQVLIVLFRRTQQAHAWETRHNHSASGSERHEGLWSKRMGGVTAEDENSAGI